MDTTSIGHAAGVIWKSLSEDKEGVTVAKIQKMKGLNQSDALAALGWLAREGKIEFYQEGRTTKVRLNALELAAVQ
jgi:hypothetical protein